MATRIVEEDHTSNIMESDAVDIVTMDSDAMDNDDSSSSNTVESFICDVCQGFGDMKNPRGFIMDREADEQMSDDSFGVFYAYTYIHHPNAGTLRAYAEAGCDLCTIIYDSLRDNNREDFDEVFAQYFSTEESQQPELVARTTQTEDDTLAATQLAEVMKQEGAFSPGRLENYSNGRILLICDCDEESGPRLSFKRHQFIYSCALTTPLLEGDRLKIFNSPFDLLDVEMMHRPSQDLLSGPHIGLINRWRDTCTTEHVSCRRTANSQPLPSRVLELLDSADTEKVCAIRLVETHGTMLGAYACLSYCWGDSSTQTQTGSTTSANISKQLQAIPFNSLPSTIVDSIHLCYKLGFQFLWVDRLCIIQDDEKDWEKEASKMCDIYSRSALTISVPLCTQSWQSFLQKRQNARGFGKKGEFAKIEYTDDQSTQKGCLWLYRGSLSRSKASWFLENSWKDFQEVFRNKGNSWIQRGWTLQEWMLSPRVLHIDTMTLWDCFEGYANELTDRCTGAPHLLRDEKDFGRYISWEFIVSEYASRRITHEKDRLPALAGLATRFQQVTGYTYLCGLWLEDMPSSLLWLKSPHRSFRQANEALPSWSWASMSSPIMFPLETHMKSGWLQPSFYPSATIYRWSSPPASITVKEKAWIDIKGHMSAVIDQGPNDDEIKSLDWQVKTGSEWWASRPDHDLEYPGEDIAQSNIHLILLGFSRRTDSPTSGCYGALVLQRCGWEDGRQCFRRLGVAYLGLGMWNTVPLTLDYESSWKLQDVRLL